MANINPASMHEMSEKIMDYLVPLGHKDFCLYVNNQCWYPSTPENATHTTAAGTPYKIVEGVDMTTRVEFCDPETVSLVFEGSLYTEINFGNGHTEMALWDIVDPYGLYFEHGTYYTMIATRK